MDTLPLIAPLIGALKEHHPGADVASIERAFLVAEKLMKDSYVNLARITSPIPLLSRKFLRSLVLMKSH